MKHLFFAAALALSLAACSKGTDFQTGKLPVLPAIDVVGISGGLAPTIPGDSIEAFNIVWETDAQWKGQKVDHFVWSTDLDTDQAYNFDHITVQDYPIISTHYFMVTAYNAQGVHGKSKIIYFTVDKNY